MPTVLSTVIIFPVTGEGNGTYSLFIPLQWLYKIEFVYITQSSKDLVADLVATYCNHCKKLKKPTKNSFSALSTLVSSRGSQHTDWKLMGNWSAFQQRHLYIDPFSWTSLPRNFVVACYFQRDCAWENSSISFITLTSLTKKSHLMLFQTLELSLGATVWTPQIWASCYLFPYSFELIFQDCLKTSLNLEHHAIADLKLTMLCPSFLLSYR